ncbi:MAG: HAD family phosphatase [Clostridia bacterium]|nr:HAD family phosphatase [Clostridia bacterium]
MSAARLYILDLDGTLIDTLTIWSDITRAFLEGFGISVTQEEIDEMDAMSFSEGSLYLRTHFGVPLSEEELEDAWLDVASSIFETRTTLMPQALETLYALRKEGATLVIFSQSPRRLVGGMLQKLGLEQAVDAVILSDETHYPKGSPDALIEVAREMGFAPENCVVVEDAPYALEAARKAGMKAVGVLDRNPRANEVPGVADLVIEAVSSLLTKRIE